MVMVMMKCDMMKCDTHTRTMGCRLYVNNYDFMSILFRFQFNVII